MAEIKDVPKEVEKGGEGKTNNEPSKEVKKANDKELEQPKEQKPEPASKETAKESTEKPKAEETGAEGDKGSTEAKNDQAENAGREAENANQAAKEAQEASKNAGDAKTETPKSKEDLRGEPLEDEYIPEEPKTYDSYDPKEYDDISDEELKQLEDNDLALHYGVKKDEAFDYDDQKYKEEGIKTIGWDDDAADTPHREQAQEGQVLARWSNKGALEDNDGRDTGSYFSDADTDYDDLQLPYRKENMEVHYYRVNEKFDYDQSTIADQKRFGDERIDPNAQQYKSYGKNAQELVDQKKITEISPEEAERLTGKKGLARNEPPVTKESLRDAPLDVGVDTIKDTPMASLTPRETVSERRIPGTPGVVTGGDSTKLGRNMMNEMGVPKDVKWGSSGYQAHHIIPKEFGKHPVIQKIGMDMDDASNGIFLRKPNDGINTKSVHYGYHEEYSKAVSKYLDTLNPNADIPTLENQVADLQKSLKTSLENGTPLYMKKEDSITGPVTYKHKGGGATEDMWTNAIISNMNKK